MLTARGANGTVTFDGNTVSLEKRSALGAKQGTKTYTLRSIGAVQYFKATALLNGYVQFSVMGEVSKKNRTVYGGAPSSDMAKDENAVIFRKSQLAEFEALVEAIRLAQNAEEAPAVTPATDPAQQIASLAALRDQGILTEDEFAAKKAELLSRM